MSQGKILKAIAKQYFFLINIHETKVVLSKSSFDDSLTQYNALCQGNISQGNMSLGNMSQCNIY